MYVYEFLWRGRANGDTAWHVILAEPLKASGDKDVHVEHGPLTPAQAKDLGFPLSAIIAEINAASLVVRDAAVAEKAAVVAERDAALAEKAAAENARDVAEARVAEMLAGKEAALESVAPTVERTKK